MNYNTKSKSGFTIIEVVLVLAIAGLIFLIVFLAVPALQRSQRDTQRRNDASRALTALSNYKSNNKGALPTTTATQGTFETSYLKTATEFKAPNSDSAYGLVWNGTGTPTSAQVQIAVGYVCTGETISNAAGDGATSRSVAVRTALEGGGLFCTSE